MEDSADYIIEKNKSVDFVNQLLRLGVDRRDITREEANTFHYIDEKQIVQTFFSVLYYYNREIK